VRDLKFSEAVKVLTEPDELVAKVMPLAKEEVEVAPVAEAVIPEVEVVSKKKLEAEEEAKEEQK